MNNPNIDEGLLKRRIAANLIYYRKLNNLTQAELAGRINYSDKSVSKWERADGVPDVYVLALLADLYNVSVNDLISENAPLPPPPDTYVQRNHIMVFLLSIGLTWLVATVAFTVLRLVLPSWADAWLVFVFAIPASCIVSIVFTSLWWGIWLRFLSVSALVWSISVCVYLTVPLYSIGLIFAVSAVMQILVFLWYMMKKQQLRSK